MRYAKVVKARFCSRPNRFIAIVRLENGKEEKVHVLNTGRCKELLTAGANVYLSRSNNPARKTLYDLIAVEKRLAENKTLLINMDSHITNAVAEEYLLKNNLFPELFPAIPALKREVTFHSSRFDFLLQDEKTKLFLEVKSVTLEGNGLVLFPDAPTLRGVKHLEELMTAKKMGYECAVLFLVQLKGAKLFLPNRKTHPQFADALKKASVNGVRVLVMDCKVTKESIFPDSSLPFAL